MDSPIARSVLLFVLAGLCEIGGYLVWLWLREERSVWLGAVGGLIPSSSIPPVHSPAESKNP